MTTFEERKQAYEAKFARDQELRFKATVRRGDRGRQISCRREYAKQRKRAHSMLG